MTATWHESLQDCARTSHSFPLPHLLLPPPPSSFNHSPIRLPNANSSSSCLQSFQSHLTSSNSLPSNLVSPCFPDPDRFVITLDYCSGILTLVDWNSKLHATILVPSPPSATATLLTSPTASTACPSASRSPLLSPRSTTISLMPLTSSTSSSSTLPQSQTPSILITPTLLPTPSTSLSSSPSQSKSSSNTTAATMAATSATLLVVFLIAGFFLWFYVSKRRKRRSRHGRTGGGEVRLEGLEARGGIVIGEAN